jgi:hypothetical protein
VDAAPDGGRFVVCRHSQLGLLRLLSNPVVMRGRACATDEAWRVYDTLMSDDRFVFREEPASVEARLREYTRGFPFSPKLWQDAYLAAFTFEAGLRLVTFDGGFQKFRGLDCPVLAPNRSGQQ